MSGRLLKLLIVALTLSACVSNAQSLRTVPASSGWKSPVVFCYHLCPGPNGELRT